MKRLGLTTAGLALVLAMAAPAAAQEPRKDLQIFKDISQSVQGYTRFTVFDDIGAVVDQGRVTLTGKVTMPYKRTDIERRVAGIDGVKTVDNRITVLPVSQFDDDLRRGIARAIYGNSMFSQYTSMANPPIHIVVEHGRVTLTGVVNTEVERAVARALAAGSNSFSVTNALQTEEEVRLALEKMGG